ncbi:toll-like receptor 5 isoform X1 [Stegostoma tigrinum]|uniref:toll-like receptor 5 isoform X1 n=1 Tax=Stegostoma tigrinum TaxID=3053191 RepID=UPI00202B4292|nr:toll-like receptor 5 isoform X1 [Stegostoma tigrinum]XP_059501130.1 toll-like receptor 5 isoform X1 [Stegostoma tigrinum]XP_059501131.1 toll-like receptor 5 isoform X1 [Stegostoma tigrinum]XP_059501132.1 toll-like receptor 5 isoform X1 [Stegostoma tigrinum]XP_059501133.1 toll-like receptor 5 isoform X1 [Stegostoma tigrinum]
MFLLFMCLLAALTAAQKASVRTCSRYQNKLNCLNRNFTEIPQVPTDIIQLNLINNRIRLIEETSFSQLLVQLRILLIGLQTEPPLRVRARAFRNLPNLMYLDLGGNKNLTLDVEAFAGLRKLQILYLDHNGLTDSILQRGHFKNLISLHTLILDGNKIKQIRPDSTFSSLRALKNVHFKANVIRQICEGDLHNVPRGYFETFDISSNRPLYANENFDWEQCGNPFKNIMLNTLDISQIGLNVHGLEKMFLAMKGTLIIHLKMQHLTIGRSFGYNNIEDPNNRTLAGLRDSSVLNLDMSHGSIFTLAPYLFSHLTFLKLLTLSFNKINQIETNAFFGLDSLLQLNLSFNLLGEIYSSTFEGLRNVTLIDLQHNHIGVIQYNAFRGLNQLMTLNLRDNALSVISGFHHLPQMAYFLVGLNRISSVYGLEAVSRSTFLDFSNNAFTNLDVFYAIMQLPFVKHLLLRENRISKCTPARTDIIPKNNQLIHLELSSNFLDLVWTSKQCWEVFHNLTNLTVLLLNQNYLTELPQDIFKGLVSLKRLNLSSNSLTKLSQGLFPSSLEILDLSENRLVSPNPDVFSFVSHLDLRQNQYICDCGLRVFIEWLNTTEVVLAQPLTDVYCVFPDNLQGTPLLSLSTDGCDEDDNVESIQFALFVFFTTLLLTIGSCVLLYNHYRGLIYIWYKRTTNKIMNGQKADEEGKAYKFDAYLCFSSNDIEWVTNSLLQYLDSQFNEKNRFQMCFEDRDFIPGEDHITNIRDAIWSSKKTVCIVTRQFLKDGWCVEAFNIAQSRLFHELREVMVVLVVGKLPDYQLMKYQPIKAYIQSRQYMRWPEDPQDHKWVLDRLAYQILQEPRRKNAELQKPLSRLNFFRRNKANDSFRLQQVATVAR